MLRLSYNNAQAGDVTLVVRPWDYAARIAPGGRLDITFETGRPGTPDIQITQKDGGEVELDLRRVDLLSISGEGVEALTPRGDQGATS